MNQNTYTIISPKYGLITSYSDPHNARRVAKKLISQFNLGMVIIRKEK